VGIDRLVSRNDCGRPPVSRPHTRSTIAGPPAELRDGLQKSLLLLLALAVDELPIACGSTCRNCALVGLSACAT